ncbi:MAG: hypothetical protein WBV89_12975, partial [Ilumatobacter sp.]
MDAIRLSADGDKPRHPHRSWMFVAASVAVLALVGGLTFAANRDSSVDPVNEPAVTVPDTTDNDGETAPAPDAEQQVPAPDPAEAGDPAPTTEAPQAQD